MATLNLLPLAEQQKRKLDLLNYYTLVGGIVLTSGVLILAATLLLFDQVYRVNLDTLKNQKVQAESQAALYLDTEKKAQTLEKQLASIKQAESQSTHWAVLMTELQKLTPPSVSIQGVKLGQGNAPAPGAAGTKTEIGGHADSRRSLGELQLAMSTSPYFKNVEILSSTTTTGTAIEYKISTDINYDKLNGPAK